MKNPAHAYRQLSVQGATPLGLVVMLYDGAIAAMQRAAVAIEERDISAKCTQLNRAQAIILQLEGTLNFEAGGEVARTLQALYTYSRAQMLKANIENSAQILRLLMEKIVTVREAWYEADHRPPAVGAAPRAEAHGAEATPEAPRANPHFPPAPAVDRSPYAASTGRESGSWNFSA